MLNSISVPEPNPLQIFRVTAYKFGAFAHALQAPMPGASLIRPIDADARQQSGLRRR